MNHLGEGYALAKLILQEAEINRVRKARKRGLAIAAVLVAGAIAFEMARGGSLW